MEEYCPELMEKPIGEHLEIDPCLDDDFISTFEVIIDIFLIFLKKRKKVFGC